MSQDHLPHHPATLGKKTVHALEFDRWASAQRLNSSLENLISELSDQLRFKNIVMPITQILTLSTWHVNEIFVENAETPFIFDIQ